MKCSHLIHLPIYILNSLGGCACDEFEKEDAAAHTKV